MATRRTDVPYLATAPLSGVERRRRRWLWPTVAAASVAAVVVLVVLFAVPVARAAAEQMTLSNAGGLSPVGETISFGHSGTFDFSWSTESGRSVTFSVLGPGGMTLYSSDTPGTTATISVSSSGKFTFEIYDWLPEQVTLHGTLHYSAPLL